VVLIALLLVVQVGLVVRDALALVQAAREGARAVAISADDDDARDTVRRSAGPLDSECIEVDIEPPGAERERGTSVTVQLRYTERLHIPIVSKIVALDLPLRASATMRLERAMTTPTPDPTASPPPPTPSPAPAPTPTPVP
jgi:Flp pilus assembly protein TadG